jgi:hypothetical protein
MPASAAMSASTSMSTMPSTVPAMPSAVPSAVPTVSVPVIAVPAGPGAAIAPNTAGPVPRPVERIAVDRIVWLRFSVWLCISISWCDGATTQARGHGEQRN